MKNNSDEGGMEKQHDKLHVQPNRLRIHRRSVTGT